MMAWASSDGRPAHDFLRLPQMAQLRWQYATLVAAPYGVDYA